MLDINAVRTALAAGVDAAQVTLNGKQVTVTKFMPDAVTPPHFAVAEWNFEPHRTFGTLAELNLTCRLFVARSGDESGQDMCGAAAPLLLAALESARGAPGQSALNGAADDLVVRRVSGPRLFDVAGVEHYGIEINVFVMGG